MSIYPVKLSQWFKLEEDEYNLYENARFLVDILKCYACGKRVRWKSAVGHHSLPWGYGDIWCSWKCCNSRKVHKFDKRQRRKFRRKYGNVIPNMKDYMLRFEGY